MPRKIQNTTKDELISVALPNHAATYTVISHQFIIDYAYQALATAGFIIVDEQYRCTADGQIATGVYKLQFNSDPELSMMFAWTNSYNKQVKFKCVVGAYINKTGAVMTSGDIGSWVRKHTGTADTETKKIIDDYITNAHMYYTQLCDDKAIMEGITLNKRKQSQLLGVLFAEYEILTTEQASMIRDQMKKPYHVFANAASLWAFYNYVTIALQNSHPKTWMEDQRVLHYFIGTIGNFQQCSTPAQVIQPVAIPTEVIEPEVDPNQTNLLDQIADLEADQMDEDIRYDANVTEELAAELYLAETTFMNARALELKLELETDAFAMAQLAGVKVPEEIMDALINAPEIDASEIDMSEVTWVTPDVAGNFTLKEIEPDVVKYTDPVGNTFETPIVIESFNDILEVQLKEPIDNEPTVEELIWGKTDTEGEEELPATEVIETIEIIEEPKIEDEFALEDNFDLDFSEDTNEDPDSVPDFF
jgi:hypothetical protein